jgi:hypothetical protein
VTDPAPAPSGAGGGARQLLPADAAADDVATMAARVADTAEAVDALVVLWKGPEPAGGWPANVRVGKTLLGARLWRRRDSPGGVEVFGPEGAAYVQRTDPDVAMLLGLGAWAPPVVG